jgi:hypothetical protein
MSRELRVVREWLRAIAGLKKAIFIKREKLTKTSLKIEKKCKKPQIFASKN